MGDPHYKHKTVQNAIAAARKMRREERAVKELQKCVSDYIRRTRKNAEIIKQRLAQILQNHTDKPADIIEALTRLPANTLTRIKEYEVASKVAIILQSSRGIDDADKATLESLFEVKQAGPF